MKKFLLITIGVIALVAAGAVYWLLDQKDADQLEGTRDERFGFLAGNFPGEFERIGEIGAGFIRPHPGPFIWGTMQKDASSEIDFDEADSLVKDAQDANLKILVTIWPFADWDQKARNDFADCFVADEFESELGEYRCIPYDWEAYQTWVSAIVERYDGDGVGDMPSLTQPVKDWEVFNEPDLQPPPEEEDGLQFFKQGPAEYGELLKKTYQAVKQSDADAQVIIAGAAGGNDQFLDFYRELFADQTIQNYFDIGNVHCISNDDYETFNAEPYKKMLAEFGIEKPVWVTEAEAFISSDPSIVATQVKLSTQNALNLGVQKIFYTSHNFENPPGGGGPGFKDGADIEADPELDGKDPIETYRKIIQSVD